MSNNKDGGDVLEVNTVELLQSGGHESKTMIHTDRYYLPTIIPKTHASFGYKSRRRDITEEEKRGEE